MSAIATSFFPAVSGRLRFIDGLRAVAAQLIVWHHLAFYGPLSDVARPLTPFVIDLLHHHARMAVQVFLVIGGFVTAQHLERLPRLDLRGFVREVARRYQRTGGPYLVTLLLAVAANAVADLWMDHRSISAAPSALQLLAHAFYLQDLLGYEALSAGIWYLAVDFQLFILVLAVSAGVRGALSRGSFDATTTDIATRAVFGALGAASLFWFNRDAAFDHWAVYFFGSYFLGMLLRWTLAGSSAPWVLAGYLAMIVAALAIDWRPRLLVAALTAVIIVLAAHRRVLQRWPDNAMVAYLGRISFSLFLVHFPICLVVNAWFSRLPLSPLQSWLAMGFAYVASLAVAVVFHHYVEAPFQRMGAAQRV
ncbi:MAG: acyltransferase [Gammaproteobacteria bacterium]|nr:acyltransferase [Gammaproteobacteria bacterium]